MADEPTNRELRQAIEQSRDLIIRNHQDFRDDLLDLKTQFARELANLSGQLAQFVIKAVYEVEKQALIDRLKRLEDNEASNRRWRYGMLTATIAAVIGAVASSVFGHLSGGGH